MKFTKKQYAHTIGGKTLTLEVSDIAGRTNAAVLGKYGETVVLATVVMGHHDAPLNYLPLKVDYEERFYAAGKIIGSRFMRREGRPSEDAILTGRLVDRTIRPLFESRMRRDIQVVVTVLAYDEENDPDFVGLAAASTALAISDVPWGGPVAGVRVAKIGKEIYINPDNSKTRAPELVLESFVAGTEGHINMIELGGNEATEDEAIDAFTQGLSEISKLVQFQNMIVKEIGRPKETVAVAHASEPLRKAIADFLEPRVEKAVYDPTAAADPHGIYSGLSALKRELMEHLKESYATEEKPMTKEDFDAADFLFEEAINDVVHKNVIESEKRPDGRKLDEIRALAGEVKLFDRTHGSALFTRGNTQALAVTTLAPPGQEQLIETMEQTSKKRFLLHYNFPSYSVGETGPFRGPGRREIGHGALADKAMRPLLPEKETFPYTIRVVSEILSSNGSSSMATVCAGILSLMDAGVPIKKMAAGIAMGLMADGKGAYKVLTDIQGPEDHHGDMDFKVAGTEDGITAMQMDVKISGIPVDALRSALAQAKKGRQEILAFMKSVIKEPRKELSRYAPIITTVKINPDKIGLLIGPGGKTINGMIERTGVLSIDIEEDGLVSVSANDPAKAQIAVDEIKALTREYTIGEVVEGNIIKLLDFGAIVDLGGGKDGMIHVSELKNGFVKDVKDVVKVGDNVRAKIIRIDAAGHIGLSMKQLQ